MHKKWENQAINQVDQAAVRLIIEALNIENFQV